MSEHSNGVAVVTGGNGGIGGAVVDRFLRRGVHVVSGVYGPDAQESALKSDHQQVSYDAVEPDAARHLLDALPPGQSVDHLVLAAGIYPHRSLLHMADAEWQEVLDVNLTSVFRVLQQVLPRLAPDGSIVLVGSIAGLRGSREHAHYAASKAALLGLMRSVMWELGGQRRINTVSPGIITTAMTESLRATSGAEILQGTPLRRYGGPEEVAAVIDFLCSSGATFVQGENISVNGGYYVN